MNKLSIANTIYFNFKIHNFILLRHFKPFLSVNLFFIFPILVPNI